MHHHPAVHVPGLTGDMVALLGGEENGQTRDVVGTGDPADGDTRER